MKKYKDVDTYIANAPEIARPHLQELRELVKATIPEAEEKIWYGVPFYFYHGSELVGFDEYKKHISFGIGAEMLQGEYRKNFEEEGYKTLKATVHIRYDQKIPTAAIKKILKAKAKMNEDNSA